MVTEAPEYSRVEAEGFAARMAGRLFCDCPYPMTRGEAWWVQSPQRRAWQNGWLDADAAVRAGRRRRGGRRRVG